MESIAPEGVVDLDAYPIGQPWQAHIDAEEARVRTDALID